ncbi:NfeD family protein [Chitinimonas viridis]|uniref:NfeD family protein n=1 Tax=Chitinimonas viridis TaxID=664880 RepID=A0ABT8B7X4_9NEIS|nr:NfeD family protein [Chitinimonas viridis]MDN3578253.1 NfeD family protein [Chitinimonas viridis]
MENYLVWFVLAAALIGLEMLVGTFYLLVYGLACALGGVAAWAGLTVVPQLVVAALGAVSGTVWLRLHPMSARRKGSDSLDIGQRVEVESWKTDTQLRVRYRGTSWDAELLAPLSDRPTSLYIVAQRSNTWVVAAEPPAA